MSVMRICSFLPSATEILYAPGMHDSVSGVTWHCKPPKETVKAPILVPSKVGGGLRPEEIHAKVREEENGCPSRGPLYPGQLTFLLTNTSSQTTSSPLLLSCSHATNHTFSVREVRVESARRASGSRETAEQGVDRVQIAAEGNASRVLLFLYLPVGCSDA